MKEIKTIEDINIINKLLSEGETLESIGKKEDFPATRTIQRHIKKLGFQFERKLGIIVPNEVLKDNIVTAPIKKESSPKKVIESNTKNNTNVTSIELSEIIKRIEVLESLMLHNNTNVTPVNIESRTDIITRSIKVSKEIMSEFTKLCETEFPMYSKQDIISTALLEFIQKHKK